MTSQSGEIASPHALLHWTVEVLSQDSEVLFLTLEGSLSRGDNDAWSDVDLDVFCQATYLERAWKCREATFRHIGDIVCIADISDIVPWSCIAFYHRSRLHLTYHTLEDYKGSGEILLDRRGILAPTNRFVLAAPVSDTLSSPRFAFWFNKAIIGTHRADKMQVAESRLRLLEIWLAMVAQSRSLPFCGLRKARIYLTLDEIQWCDNYLENLYSLDLVRLLPELVQAYLEILRDTALLNIDMSGVRFIEAMLVEMFQERSRR